MGHVNPAVCQPKDSWRWQTSNSEYGKFYVRKHQREVCQEAENEYLKKCEELSNELQEAKAQLEKLKLSRDLHICGPVRLHDEACQTSPLSPKRDWTITTKAGQPNRKMYKTLKKNNDEEVEGHDCQMLLDHGKEDKAHRMKRERQKIPPLSLRNGRNNPRDGDYQDNEDVEYPKTEIIPSGCGLRCLMSRSGSRNSSSSGSAKDREQLSPRKRKILQKHRGAPKKQKGSLVKATSHLKRTAAGGANLPPSQRYDFYRKFGNFSTSCMYQEAMKLSKSAFNTLRLQYGKAHEKLMDQVIGDKVLKQVKAGTP